MINLGKTYFYKYLSACEPEALQQRVESAKNVLSTSMQRKYSLGDWELLHGDMVRRWSSGIYAANEQVNKFPRVAFSLESPAGDYWVLEVLFTCIPSVRAHYGNRRTNHTIPADLETDLGTRLVASDAADVVDAKSARLLLGTETGIYVHEKLSAMPALRERVESEKYLPPSSELKELLQVLPQALTEQQIKIPTNRSQISEFLQSCDERLIAALGEGRLEQLLRPIGVEGDTWLKAGHRSRLWRFSLS